MQAVLKTENLKKEYGREQILKGIDLSIKEGTFTSILGPSGSGKSTLLSILSGLIRPTEGKVLHGDTEVSALKEPQLADWKRNSVGNVFQNYLLLSQLTVRENIMAGIAPGREPLAFDRLVRLLEIEPVLKKFPAQLSGGQQQRAAIARAVIKGPSLLFCDEATGALDEANSKKVIGLLHRLKAAFGITVLFTTHNRQIAKTSDRVLTIRDGLIYSDIINENPISAEDMVWGEI